MLVEVINHGINDIRFSIFDFMGEMKEQDKANQNKALSNTDVRPTENAEVKF